MPVSTSGPEDEGVSTAVKHALGWLVLGNSVGLYMSLLLLMPEWQLRAWTYGRWVPVHLNVQLYGWTALPLVAWLFSMYEVNRSKVAAWAPAAVWAWTAALAVGALQWLNGVTGGKIFLDWKSGALWGFITALVLLWILLALSWKEFGGSWSRLKRRVSLGGLIGLALVPAAIVMTANPATYPPVDRLSGGPTGSSLLGSALVVVGLLLLLPRSAGMGKGHAGRGTWGYFGFCWVVFALAEFVGGTHLDWWQNGSLLLMPPWAWLLVRDWRGFDWPDGSRFWRGAVLGWWGMLVVTGYLVYFPQVLDRIKFTQGLVAHSHLAMAGFTTSFCVLLIGILTRRRVSGMASASLWHLAAVIMIATLAMMGWHEGSGSSWMMMKPQWRESGLVLRSACGLVMLWVSVSWLIRWKTR